MPEFPTVHVNGTSAKELCAQGMEVIRAADKLTEALRKMTPNGRDYYVRDNLTQALSEHQGRLLLVKAVRDEVEAIVMHVSEQDQARGR